MDSEEQDEEGPQSSREELSKGGEDLEEDAMTTEGVWLEELLWPLEMLHQMQPLHNRKRRRGSGI